MPAPQNGQVHSKNSSETAANCLIVFDHFVGLALEGLSFLELWYGFVLYVVYP